MNKWISIAGFMLAAAVALGAFGAHGLKDKLDVASMQIYEKAVFYHFIHALGILIVALLAHTHALDVRGALMIVILLCMGILIFSGSLYLLAVTRIRWLGMITPVGGIAYVSAWVLLALRALKS